MKTKKRLLSILLSLVMVLGLVLGMSLTAYAATETYTNLMNNKTVVKFNNHDWIIIADDSTATGGTVTLLAADTSFGTSKFHDSSNAYSGSTVKSNLDALTEEGGSFAGVKDAIEDTDLTDVGVTGAKLYLLSTGEAGPYANFNFTGAQNGDWWLRSPGINGFLAAFVFGEYGDIVGVGDNVEKEYGVRPALKLNLSSVIFSSESKTFIVIPEVIPEFGDPDFAMPEDLTAIGESAFEGVTSMEVVDARSCTAIGQDAFKGTGIRQIRLPKNCTINDAAFDQDGMIYVYAPSGGTTETCCAQHDNLVFVAEAE